MLSCADSDSAFARTKEEIQLLAKYGKRDISVHDPSILVQRDAPDYSWINRGIVIQTGESDDSNAIEPTLLLTKDDELWMSFGSYWSGIKLIHLDAETGLRSKRDMKVCPLAWNRDIEAAQVTSQQ